MVQEAQRKASECADLMRSLVVLDGGNRFANGFRTNGDQWALPAVVKELQPWEDSGYDDRSVEIRVGDRRWVVGEIAQQLGGEPVFKSEKAEWYWLLVAAALEPTASSGVMGIDCLRLLCTDSRAEKFQLAAAYIKSLDWTNDRSFWRNGEKVTLTGIRRVELINEGVPPWRYAKSHGWWKYPHMNNGVLDIGGGDFTGRIITPSGVLVRSADISDPGTNELASMIQSAIQQQWQHTPPSAAIMVAIANGTYELQGANLAKISFKPAFDLALPLWIDKIKASIKAKWVSNPQIWTNIGEVLIVGGSAPLLQQIEIDTEGRFKIARHDAVQNFSQLINAYGMLEG